MLAGCLLCDPFSGVETGGRVAFMREEMNS